MGKSLPRGGDLQVQRMQVGVVGSWPDRWWAGAVAKSRWKHVHQGVRPGGLRRVWHLQGLSSSQACWKALGTDLGQNRSGLKG